MMYQQIASAYQKARTAVQMHWDRGFTWKDITIEGAKYGFNATSKGQDKDTSVEQSTWVSLLP